VNFYKSKVIPGIHVPIKHTPEDMEIITNVASSFNPVAIFELGTLQGGLTLLLHEACPEVAIVTFDQKPVEDEAAFKVLFRGPGSVIAYTGDIFKPAITDFILTMFRACSFGPKLLYCDDGNKPLEVNTFGPLLASGDLLGVHDWGSEVKMLDVAQTLVDFTPHREEEMKNREVRFFLKK